MNRDSKDGPSDGPDAKDSSADDGAKGSDERPKINRPVIDTAVPKSDEPTESDWLFEYVDSVMKSPAWESEVMGFVDDNCMIFDNEDENKLEHTVVHNKFQEVVDGLLMTHLEDVNVTPEAFASACERARYASRNNRAVFEQLMAMTDFLTFKKLMVKRNMELELEAVAELQRAAVPIVAPADEDEAERLYQMALKESAEMSAAEARALLRKARDQAGIGSADSGGKEAEPGDYPSGTAEGGRPGSSSGGGARGSNRRSSSGKGAQEDAELMKALDLNLMELEMQNRQFELEQQELEQAIAMSLYMEQERLDLAVRQAEIGASRKLQGLEVYGDVDGDVIDDSDDEDDDDDDNVAVWGSVDSTPPVFGQRTGAESPMVAEASALMATSSVSGSSSSVRSPVGRPSVAEAKEGSSSSPVLSSSSPEASSGRTSVLGSSASPLSQAPAPAKGSVDDDDQGIEGNSSGSGIRAALSAETKHSARPTSSSSKGDVDDDDADAVASTTSDPSSSSSLSSLAAMPSIVSKPAVASGQRAFDHAAQEVDAEIDAVAAAAAKAERKARKREKRERRARQAAAAAAAADEGNEGSYSAAGGGGGGGSMQALAPLPSVAELQAQMARKRAEAEAAFKRNQEALAQQKAAEIELAEAAGVTADDTARRAAHLKQQRDKLLAKKRAERESKAKAYDDAREVEIAHMLKTGGNGSGSINRNGEGAADAGGGGDSKGDGMSGSGGGTEEERRAMMRVALARRMKQDLLIGEAERLTQMQDEQYTELDKQLKLVEELRFENRVKEREMAANIRQQQEARFRNLQQSIAQGIVDDDA